MGAGRDAAVLVDGAAAQQGAHHAGAQRAAGEGVRAVAVQRLERVPAAQVDEREVGVGAGLQAALGQAEAPRGRARHELGERGDRHPPGRPFVQQHRQRRLRARDPAPGGAEAALLHCRRAGRVVGGHQRDPPARELLPQRVAVRRGAQRRGALGERAEALEVVLGQREVVRACLARHVGAAPARVGDRRHPGARGDVHHVQRAAGRVGERDRALDRRELRLRRARGDPGAPVLAVHRAQLGGALGVHEHGQPERGGALHAGGELVVVHGVEVVDAGVAHERLEARHAALGELVHPLQRAGHEPAPEREVDLRRGPRGRQLGVEGRAVDGRRVRVERHLDARRRAAGRERGRAGLPALPVGAAGLVEVHVRVERAGQDVQPARVELLA